ncbi:hypothetical protein [Thalassotalea litorea]|uniref:hypothetical protein n=1 Tax=Thalassotalea litorea TaxID=2020715 RepID=UPI0037351673
MVSGIQIGQAIGKLLSLDGGKERARVIQFLICKAHKRTGYSSEANEQISKIYNGNSAPA